MLNETNRQYYQGYQKFTGDGNNKVFTTTFDTDLVWGGTYDNPSTNFRLYTQPSGGSISPVNTGFTVSGNTITFNAAPANLATVSVQLLRNDGGEFGTGSNAATGNITEDNYGSYAYIKLEDVINNFIVGYVGEGELIPKVKRSKVIFHAKRGLQEFSYDVLKSIKSQELTIPPSLSLVIPQDYVNYVKLSWIDELGVKRIIQPTTLTSNPLTMPQQNSTTGVPEQNTTSPNPNIERTSSTTETAWDAADVRKITGDYDNNSEPVIDRYDNLLGQRYGLTPETTQKNGWFTINEREGKFSFSSNLNGNVIILEYISDGLATDLETKVPKLAEEALYAHLSYSILAGKSNQPEYVVRRLKQDRSAKIRNAKIRLSNIKMSEITQVMRNKSKWIK